MDCYKLKPETNFVWSISAGGRFGCVCTFHSDFFHDRCNCWVCTFHISVIHHEHLPSCQVPLVCSSRLSHQLSRIEKTTSVQNSCCVRESLSTVAQKGHSIQHFVKVTFGRLTFYQLCNLVNLHFINFAIFKVALL